MSAKGDSTYDTDFYLWTQQQAALLRQCLMDGVDAPHLADEIESIGKMDRRAFATLLRALLSHLLKWRNCLDQRGENLVVFITQSRYAIEDILADSPSLSQQLPVLVDREYRRARRNADIETGLSMSMFPEQPPFTIQQILDADYWPD